MAKPIIHHARQILYDDATTHLGVPVGVADVKKVQQVAEVLHDRLQAQVPSAPASYAGQTTKFPRVNAAETAFELVPLSELLIIPTHDLTMFQTKAYWPLVGTEPAGNTGFLNNPNVLIGVTVNQVDGQWTYNNADANPHDQSVNHGVGALAVALRVFSHMTAYTLTPETYTITANGFEFPIPNVITQNSVITFRNLRYWGVHNADLTVDPNADDTIRGLLGSTFNREFITGKTVTKNFNASLGTPPNYLYYAYPSSFGAPATMTMGGFAFSQYSTSTFLNFDNGTGYLENYIIVKTDLQYSTGVPPGINMAITS